MADLLKPISITMEDGATFTGLLSLTQDENAVLLGNGAPAITPNFVGQGYLDRVAKQFYSSNNLGQWVPMVIGTDQDPVNLNDLGDVTLTNLANNQVLFYNGTQWINTNVSSITGASRLRDLTDVQLSNTPADGHVLKYNAGSGRWVNGPATASNGVQYINDLMDVELTPAVDGQFLYFNNGQWRNDNGNLNLLTDVSVPNPLDNQILRYNGTFWAASNETQWPDELREQNDVSITSPQTGDILRYDDGTWINAPLEIASNSIFLNDIADVTLTNPLPNQTLVLGSGGQWLNRNYVDSIAEQSDVQLFNLQPNQFLRYDGNRWVNGNLEANLALNDLSDVNISSQVTGLYLGYNSSTNRWESRPVHFAALNGINLTTPTDGQILQYDGVNWRNVNLGAGISIGLDDLSDVRLTDLETNQTLRYDGVRWVNTSSDANSLDGLSDVEITNPQPGQLLYRSNDHWYSAYISTNDLADVSVLGNDTPLEGEVLTYWVNPNNHLDAKWRPSPITTTLAGQTDVELTQLQTNDVLSYNGTRWVNSSISTAGSTQAYSWSIRTPSRETYKLTRNVKRLMIRHLNNTEPGVQYDEWGFPIEDENGNVIGVDPGSLVGSGMYETTDVIQWRVADPRGLVELGPEDTESIDTFVEGGWVNITRAIERQGPGWYEVRLLTENWQEVEGLTVVPDGNTLDTSENWFRVPDVSSMPNTYKFIVNGPPSNGWNPGINYNLSVANLPYQDLREVRIYRYPELHHWVGEERRNQTRKPELVEVLTGPSINSPTINISSAIVKGGIGYYGFEFMVESSGGGYGGYGGYGSDLEEARWSVTEIASQNYSTIFFNDKVDVYQDIRSAINYSPFYRGVIGVGQIFQSHIATFTVDNEVTTPSNAIWLYTPDGTTSVFVYQGDTLAQLRANLNIVNMGARYNGFALKPRANLRGYIDSYQEGYYMIAENTPSCSVPSIIPGKTIREEYFNFGLNAQIEPNFTNSTAGFLLSSDIYGNFGEQRLLRVTLHDPLAGGHIIFY